ncbi:MAG: YidC/Oxa1 family membrane protein insertase [Acidimicrobiales bacterium]
MSTIDKFLGPIFQLLGAMLAFFYGLVPNYAIAIVLLTIAVMAVMSPLVVKSTRSMVQLQRLAPELKKLQQKYKGDRQRLSEEMMAFYKEHHVSPTGGCLPMFLQLPVFFVLYGVLGGMAHTTGGKHPKLAPLYIPHKSLLYHHLLQGHGKLISFGVDFGNKALGSHSSVLAAIPFWTIVALAIGLQYFQMRQLSGRNPQMAEMNPQMQAMQKYLPLVFGLIYLNISAGVNVYFITSSLWRIGLQGALFRFDPVLQTQAAGSVVSAQEGDAAKSWNAIEKLRALGSSGRRFLDAPPANAGDAPAAGSAGKVPDDSGSDATSPSDPQGAKKAQGARQDAARRQRTASGAQNRSPKTNPNSSRVSRGATAGKAGSGRPSGAAGAGEGKEDNKSAAARGRSGGQSPSTKSPGVGSARDKAVSEPPSSRNGRAAGLKGRPQRKPGGAKDGKA